MQNMQLTLQPRNHTPKMFSSFSQTSSVFLSLSLRDYRSWNHILGYIRVLLAGISLHYMDSHPLYCTITYVVSCLLDAVDGQVARALGQTSKFGAVLDMVTDRSVKNSVISIYDP